MKSKNDYLAEYIREKCPAVERSIDFSLWKFSKSLTGIAARVSKAKKESSLTGKDVDMIMLERNNSPFADIYIPMFKEELERRW